MASALYIVQQFFPKVTKVIDAKKDRVIEVTKGDNAGSKVKDHAACALAIACKRQLHLTGVIVSIDRAYLIKGDTATRYFVPRSAQREIVSFDRSAGFSAGDYQLKAPSQAAKLGTYKGGHNGNAHTPSTLAHRFRHITDGIRSALGVQEIEE